MSLDRSRVLVTGADGFIGSHLSEALLARGDQVHVLDDLSTGSIDNIEHLKPHDGFQYTIDTVMNEPLTAEHVDRCELPGLVGTHLRGGGGGGRRGGGGNRRTGGQASGRQEGAAEQGDD